MLAGLLGLVAPIATEARAQGNEFRIGTWNMNRGAGNDWFADIPDLLANRDSQGNVHGLNILALQEHNNGLAFFDERQNEYVPLNDGVMVDGTTDANGNPVNVRWQELLWTHPDVPAEEYHVYVLEAANRDRARVIISDRPADDVRVVPAVAPAAPADRGAVSDGAGNQRPRTPQEWVNAYARRPALGIRIGGTWVFTVHTNTDGAAETRYRDASGLLRGVRAAAGTAPWVAVGDWNIQPGDAFWQNELAAGESFARSGQPTYPNRVDPVASPPVSEYDYAVASGVTPRGGDRITHTRGVANDLFRPHSDHFPVALTFPPVSQPTMTADGLLHTIQSTPTHSYVAVHPTQDLRADGAESRMRDNVFMESGTRIMRPDGYMYLHLSPLAMPGLCLVAKKLIKRDSQSGDDTATLGLAPCAAGDTSAAQLWRFDELGNLFNADDRAVWMDDGGSGVHLGQTGKEPLDAAWEHCSWTSQLRGGGMDLLPVSCSDGRTPPPFPLKAPVGIQASFLDLTASAKERRTVVQLFSGGQAATLRFDEDDPGAGDTLSPPSGFPVPQDSVLKNVDAAVDTLDSMADGTFLAFSHEDDQGTNTPFCARLKPGAQGMADAAPVFADQPKPISEAFHALRGTVFENGVDAIVNVPGDLALAKEVFLFKGDQYARMSVDLGGTGDKITNGPLSIANNWGALKAKAPEFTRDIDSAFQIKNFVYFFKGDSYVKVKVTPNVNGDTVVEGPAKISERFPSLRGTVFSGELPPTSRTDRIRQIRQAHAAAGWATPREPGGSAPENGRYTTLLSRSGLAADLNAGNTAQGTPVLAWAADPVKANQQWQLRDTGGGNWQIGSALAPGMVLDHDASTHRVTLWTGDAAKASQQWQTEDFGHGWYALHSAADQKCLTATGQGADLTIATCDASAGQLWKLSFTTPPSQAGDPFDNTTDNRSAKPAVSGSPSQCRPDGMAVTAGADTRYCDVYDTSGREWLGGAGHDKRVVGYFTGWRSGAKGDARYLVKNIPWSKVTHVNYAFANIVDNKISIGNTEDPANPATGMTWPGVEGAEMDPSLPYLGHVNQLAKYKKQHPQVKVLMSVGGWADTQGFYALATNADGSVNQAGINTFADSVAGFLNRFKDAFDGIDIDYEYPTALPDTGNPNDWSVANPRRKGLGAGYTALMKTLRTKLDETGADRARYYLLTSAASASGYLVRGYDAGQALQYQDFVNVMSYDLHGSWNNYVGPQAPLYDDGRDNELASAGIYDSAKNPEYDRTGYFNVDWAYHYYRGALPPSRINLGIPYYTRGWQNVTGGTDGLWGTSALPDQKQCQPGTGSIAPCGNGAVGIDNIWHDLGGAGQEVAAGSNPLWHAKN
ncbi:glycosyl hydrolase family 18 protein [Kitasatospora sp. NPDC086801]|uniref:glycosyl hydrolase family 18 protein n=1 Tax=Kitasatospora sp. NPDC086801 TaxID=3364066 RepID=UPI0038186BDA